jgi:hypothetical protein
MRMLFTPTGVQYSADNTNASLPSYYGNMQVALVTDQRVFFSLLDEICKESVRTRDGINFYQLRVSILDAFMQQRLFGVSIEETEEMYQRDAMMDGLFMVEGFYDIPCFCITAKQVPDTVEMMWVADRAGGKYIEELIIDTLRLQPTANTH